MSNTKFQVENYLEIFRQYMLNEGLANSTRQQYLSIVKIFLQHFRQPVHKISSKKIAAYLAQINHRKTRYQAHYAIGKYCQVLGLPQKMNGIPRPKQAKTLPEYFTYPQVLAMLNSTTNLKHKMMIALMFYGMLRRSEVLKLRVKHVDFENCLIQIKQSKGLKDRAVPLPKFVFIRLGQYFAIYQPQSYLFEGATGGKYSGESLGNVVKQAIARCGLPMHLSCHTLRHSGATYLAAQGLPMRDLQEILGHYKLETTMQYSHVTANQVQGNINAIYSAA